MKLSCSGIARKLVDLLMSTLAGVLGAMTKTDKGRGSYTTRGVICAVSEACERCLTSDSRRLSFVNICVVRPSSPLLADPP